jgi:hypothetical protein
VENFQVSLSRIVKGFQESITNTQEFIIAINEQDERDLDDIFYVNGLRSTVPFQLNKLHPDSYPCLLEGIAAVCKSKKRSALQGLLEEYDGRNPMDQYVLIWSLKSIAKVTYPDEDIEWKPPRQKNCFIAAVILLGYLAMRTGREEAIDIFMRGYGRTWKITEEYYIKLGVLRIGSNIASGLRLKRDPPTGVLERIEDLYNALDEEGLKRFLNY